MNAVSKSVLATGAAALLFGLTAAAPAQAGGKGKHFHFGHHHHKHIHGYGWGPGVYVGSGYGGCGYYKRMFWRTGNYYWKAKYYDCLY